MFLFFVFLLIVLVLYIFFYFLINIEGGIFLVVWEVKVKVVGVDGK